MLKASSTDQDAVSQFYHFTSFTQPFSPSFPACFIFSFKSTIGATFQSSGALSLSGHLQSQVSVETVGQASLSGPSKAPASCNRRTHDWEVTKGTARATRQNSANQSKQQGPEPRESR